MTDEQFAELERTLPPVFSRTEVPKLLGGLISAGRLANLDSEGLGPRKFKVGRKVGYTRNDFLVWLKNRSAGLPLDGNKAIAAQSKKEV